MKRFAVGMLAAVVSLMLAVPAVLAYHCTLLVKECEALAAKMEKRADADKAMVADAMKGCKEALKLHEAGKHKESMIKAGEAITLAGKSLK